MKAKLIILGTLLIIVGFPLSFYFFLHRQEKSSGNVFGKEIETLTILTPHVENVRQEIELGFKEWYLETTGKRVNIDWRYVGSGNETSRYLNALFENAFRLHWEKRLGKPWTQAVAYGFSCEGIEKENSIAGEARRAFLDSNVGCRIDLLFGGGLLEYKHQKEKQQLAPCSLLKDHPELFGEDGINEFLSGERIWDSEGYWIGSCFSSIGIGYNHDRLKQLGFNHSLHLWEDLTAPEFFGQLGLVDPSKSSIVMKGLEVILQEQIAQELKGLKAQALEATEEALLLHAISGGWLRGLRLFQKLAANTRYFSDLGTKSLNDILAGNVAAGILVDFYGRSQQQTLRLRSNKARFGYVIPQDGSLAAVDPIALLKGTQNSKLANEFIYYICSLPGQKVMGFRVGAPGGPKHYPIGRAPVHRQLYTPQLRAYLVDPNYDPYESSKNFFYHESWTKKTLPVLCRLFKVIFIDAHKELSRAWKAILEAKPADKEKALEYFQDFSKISYKEASTTIVELLAHKNHLKILQLQSQLTQHFRRQYRAAECIARGMVLQP